ncbi:MAG: hypothetical protein OHK005_19620 [Candidatus Methylacidiphilales bacterium]
MHFDGDTKQAGALAGWGGGNIGFFGEAEENHGEVEMERFGPSAENAFVKFSSGTDQEVFDRALVHVDFAREGDGAGVGIDLYQAEFKSARSDGTEGGVGLSVDGKEKGGQGEGREHDLTLTGKP